MKKKFWMILGVVMVAGLAAVPLVHAELSHGGRAHAAHEGFGMMDGLGPLGRLRWVKSQLDLSDAQVEQIHLIADDVHAKNAAYRTEIRGNMHNVAKVLLDDPANVTGAQQLLDQQAATEQQLRTNILGGVSKALAVLTPEQRVKLREILDARAARG